MFGIVNVIVRSTDDVADVRPSKRSEGDAGMGASLLITLREGLEISLVLAILATALVRAGRAAALRHMWIGAGAAMVVCAIGGIAFHLAVGEFEGKSEQLIEGALAASAAIVLTWMIFWMRRNAPGHVVGAAEQARRC